MGLKDEEVGHLEELAKKRKERLLALRQQLSNATLENEENTESSTEATVCFRNYTPQAKELEANVLPSAKPANLDKFVEEQLTVDSIPTEIKEVEISNLAPKKVNFDLRRGIEAVLEKAERRTDKAIAELIRERLKEGRQQDFLLAVAVGAKVMQTTSFDSDED